jgi:hypothetical protein
MVSGLFLAGALELEPPQPSKVELDQTHTGRHWARVVRWQGQVPLLLGSRLQ